MRRKIAGRCFLKPFFPHSKKLFSEFPCKIFDTVLHDIIGLQNFSLSFCQSFSRITMCNLHWCYTFCTGVTLFALVLHLNCTALSQSESSNFFMCIIRSVIILVINKSDTRCAVVRLCYHLYDYRPNWTPLSPITITNFKKLTERLCKQNVGRKISNPPGDNLRRNFAFTHSLLLP